jgi:predicted ATPase/DNA-binding SARP family transcriptional activator
LADVVRVRLLGGFDASAGERSVPAGAWRLRKARTLVKLLALEAAHSLHRDQVIDTLWPDLGSDAGRNNLHQVIHAARRAMSTLGVDGAAVLSMQDDLLTLGRDLPVVTDVEELRSAAETAAAAGQHDELVQLLHDSAGELLPEDAYETWARHHAVAYQEWRTRLVMDVVEAQLDNGDADKAVVLLAPIVGADPMNEPANRALMRALGASGRRSEALLVYERLRGVLRDELAAEPEAQTREVFRALLIGAAGLQEPVTIPSPRPAGNLPARMTPLVGRGRELTETRAILGRTRLLTLTGMGGAGKTTLAIELARRSAADFPGGVHLVELGALTDGEQVAPQIARGLLLEVPPDAPPVEAIVAQLRQRQLLVVLDNCEHLLDACARVVSELLRGCPGLYVLATSREALRIEGEVSWRTPSLDLPDPSAASQLPELADVASVELFVARASAALPEFALTEDNASAVAEICYRLDGIPLALELAAACIPTLSPQQIAGRLGDSLNLLRRGGRATITRQQTLEATLAWSHELLAPDEQVLFRRLAVFAGSCTLEAVESVCGADLEQRTVLASLARLVDTSLVIAEARSDVTRYRLLETVRQYATDRLRSAGEQSATQERHCDWYLHFAQERDPEYSPAPSGVMPTSIDVEHDNLRAALTWSLRDRPDVALELAVALWRYWLARGFFAEGRRWLEATLAAAPDPSALRARALTALAVFDARRGTSHRLADLGAEAVGIHRSLGARDGLAQALHFDAVLAYMRGSWDEAWLRSLESSDVATDAKSPQLEVAARHVQALVLMGRGQLPNARAAFDDVRAALRQIPESAPAFLPPVLIGFAVDGTGTDSPRVYFEETVLLGRLVRVDQAHGYVLCNLADLARLAGDYDEALQLADDAVAAFTAIGDRDGEALALSRRGCLHRVRGEFREGRDALIESLRLRGVLGDRRGIGLARANLGVLTAAEGDVARGAALIEQALAASIEIQDEAARVGLTLTLASVYAEAGMYPAAEAHLTAALDDSRRIPGNSRATAWAYAALADVLRRQGRADEGAQALRQAHELFAALGAVDGARAGSLQMRL